MKYWNEKNYCTTVSLCTYNISLKCLKYMYFCFRTKMADFRKVPILCLAWLFISLLTGQTCGVAVMSIDIGSEWLKVAIVSVRINLYY